MDIFECPVSPQLLSDTNKIWNELKLNSGWYLGTVSSLIHAATFQNKREWEHYYYQSGMKRRQTLATLTEMERRALCLVGGDLQRRIKQATPAHKALNYNHGRTKKELQLIGNIMFTIIQERYPNMNITQRQCQQIVIYHTIGETWNGIQKREVNTIQHLQKHFPSATFERIRGHKDAQYEVDVEMYEAGKLVCGVQIKPVSYKKKFGFKDETLEMNVRKNALYTETFGVPVFYIFSSISGEIDNRETLTELSKTLIERSGTTYA